MSFLKQLAQQEGETFYEEYQVALPGFNGPMDVLLGLIEQEHLEITKIALAQVTDQYLAFIKALQEVTPDILTDFLNIAAKLLLLKSQMLLPSPPAGILEDEEDSVDDLIQQLKDYKRFKTLAADLRGIEARGERNFVRIAPPPKIEPKLSLDDVSLDALLMAVRRALTVKPKAPLVGTVVSPAQITIGHQIDRIRDRLTDGQAVNFGELLSQGHSRVEIIVTLLAVLELIKRRMVDVSQIESFGEIMVIKKDDVNFKTGNWDELSQLHDVT